jgi:hypothetical protein
MKVTVTRTGGVGNLKRKAERDYNGLTHEQPGKLDAIVDQTPVEQQDRRAERSMFTIDIQDQRCSRRTTLSEAEMAKELKEMVMGLKTSRTSSRHQAAE